MYHYGSWTSSAVQIANTPPVFSDISVICVWAVSPEVSHFAASVTSLTCSSIRGLSGLMGGSSAVTSSVTLSIAVVTMQLSAGSVMMVRASVALGKVSRVCVGRDLSDRGRWSDGSADC